MAVLLSQQCIQTSKHILQLMYLEMAKMFEVSRLRHATPGPLKFIVLPTAFLNINWMDLHLPTIITAIIFPILLIDDHRNETTPVDLSETQSLPAISKLRSNKLHYKTKSSRLEEHVAYVGYVLTHLII